MNTILKGIGDVVLFYIFIMFIIQILLDKNSYYD